MISVRPIEATEADDFFSILCESFDLDAHRARPIFFQDPGFDLSHKWALFDGGRMHSILTSTRMEFGFGGATGIAGVATRTESRGQGYAAKLIECVAESFRASGPESLLLFATKTRLYESLGFEQLDAVVSGPIQADGTEDEWRAPLEHAEVQLRYGAWQGAQTDWCIRSEARWRNWSWSARVCEPIGDTGYLCFEGITIREAIVPVTLRKWPVPEGTEWVGLAGVTQQLQVPAACKPTGTLLLGRGTKISPRMFLTDQF